MVTEKDCIEAIRQILTQLYFLTDAGFPRHRIGRVEREAIFFIYEGSDKYGDSKPHSAAARQLRRLNSGTLPPKTVTYDHAIPLASMRDEMRAATVSTDAMAIFLKRFIRGVVLTREENNLLNLTGLRRRLPEGAASHDMLARYRAVGIVFEAPDEAMLCENLSG